MSLQLYNTLGGRKQTFVPLRANRVTMYVCGPTVYNLAHIGNARPAVVFDTLYRLLQTHYDEVIYVRNITDIDDKIIAAMQQSGLALAAFTAGFSEKYQQDMTALNSLPPSLEPRATDHIAEMIALAATLQEKGHAYEADGHLLFAVQSMPDYGRLSNRSLEDMRAGARVEVADYKRYPGDFVLWKPAPAAEPGWDSPWGRGRPGWHLECSAMARAHLGATIDIHGGGRDLIFPHHENEIAQSRCAHGGDYVRYWLHNAYLTIDDEKMAKSRDNFRMVRDLLLHYPGEVLRFALLSAHYRSALNFSADVLAQSAAALDSLYGALREVQHVAADSGVSLAGEDCYQALNDDLNTPLAIAGLHALARALRRAAPAGQPALKARLLAAAGLLGVLQQSPDNWFQIAPPQDAISPQEIESLLQQRRQARLDSDFAAADALRESLRQRGVVLEDKPDGTRWRREQP